MHMHYPGDIQFFLIIARSVGCNIFIPNVLQLGIIPRHAYRAC